LPQWVPQHQHSERIKGLAASFCHGAGLRRVFATWQRNAALKRAVTTHWQRLALVKGWNSWRAFLEVRARLGPWAGSCHAGLALQRTRSRTCTPTPGCWLRATRSCRGPTSRRLEPCPRASLLTSPCAATLLQERAAKRQQLTATLLHWQNSHAWKALSTWQQHAAQRRHKGALLQRALGWLRNATLLKAVLSWREAALEQQAARQAATKVRRRRPPTPAPCCPAWRSGALESGGGAVERMQGSEADAPSLLPLPPQAITYWVNASLAKAFATWLDWAQHSAGKRGKLQRALGHWSNGALARAFATWRGWAGERLELAAKMERVGGCSGALCFGGGRLGPWP
jgi:hypothetical protein